MNFKITENKELQNNLEESLKKLKRTRVSIGLPGDASSRNKFLLALHERGSPINRIPPRPVVGPALSSPEARSGIQEGLLSACEAAAEGNPSGIQPGFEKAGEAGVHAIQAYIDAGVPPPNAPVTVSGGWVYNRSARKGVKVEGKGFNKPLVETGELYSAFTWTVDDP